MIRKLSKKIRAGSSRNPLTYMVLLFTETYSGEGIVWNSLSLDLQNEEKEKKQDNKGEKTGEISILLCLQGCDFGFGCFGRTRIQLSRYGYNSKSV